MKGKSPDAELAELAPSLDVFHVEPLAVPGLEAQRCIVWMRERVASPTA
jgi:16S rRNA (guanine527-N7)-methyltransferase